MTRIGSKEVWQYPNCPDCGGKLRMSNIENDKLICKKCNTVHLMDNQLKITKKVVESTLYNY